MARSTKALTPKALQTRQSIINAGMEIVASEGAHGVNVIAVCDKAGTGRTSFYNYFDDIADLLAIVAESAAQEIQSRFNDLHSDLPRGLERLEACLKMIFDLAASEPETIRLVVEIARTNETIPQLLESEIRAELEGATNPGRTLPREINREVLVHHLMTCTLAIAREMASGSLPQENRRDHLAFLMAACCEVKKAASGIQGRARA